MNETLLGKKIENTSNEGKKEYMNKLQGIFMFLYSDKIYFEK